MLGLKRERERERERGVEKETTLCNEVNNN